MDSNRFQKIKERMIRRRESEENSESAAARDWKLLLILFFVGASAMAWFHIRLYERVVYGSFTPLAPEEKTELERPLDESKLDAVLAAFQKRAVSLEAIAQSDDIPVDPSR